MNEKMGVSMVAGQAVMNDNTEYWGDVGKLLLEKD